QGREDPAGYDWEGGSVPAEPEPLALPAADGAPSSTYDPQRAPEEPRRRPALPAWSRGTARVTFRGQPVELSQSAGYADIDAVFAAGDVIELELDMTPRFVGVHHRLDASRGAVALERGPLVYALENADQTAGPTADDAAIDPRQIPDEGAPIAELDGAVPLTVAGSLVQVSEAAAAWPYPSYGSADAD